MTLRKAGISEMLVKPKYNHNLASAPPTLDAASLQAYRVFYQMIYWKNLAKMAINAKT